MSLTALGIAGVNAALLCAAVVRLQPLHPATLWLGMWTFASALYALHLLPYAEPSLRTGVVAASGSVSFVVGAFAGEWIGGGAVRPREGAGAPPTGTLQLSVAIAALLAGALTAVMLGAFLLQVSATYGLRDAIVASADVRRAIGDGFAGPTIKFVYPALAGSSLAGLAAALCPHQRVRWAALAAACILSTYFSTGRSSMLIAATAAAVAYAMATSIVPSWRAVAVGAALVVVGTMIAFLGVGQLLGKTFANSEIATMQTPFTDSALLQPLALPYHYVSTPLAALNEEVYVTSTWGRARGCASGRELCAMLAKAGIAVHPEPRIRPFTGKPLAWNTYTALDRPLIDFGVALFWVVTLLTGGVVGILWRLACSSSLEGMAAYALSATAVVYSTVQYNFLAPHIVGGVAIAIVALRAGRYIAARPDERFWKRLVVQLG